MNVRFTRAANALAVVALTALGGCSDQIHLGLDWAYWSADHETGTLLQWNQETSSGAATGGQAALAEAGVPGAFTGGQAVSATAALTVVGAPTHSGNFAVRSAINATGNVTYARLFRLGSLPQDAYFRVWMYIPARYNIASYWNLFEFQGRSDPADPASQVYLWSLDLARRSDGELSWYVWDGQRSRQLNPLVPTVAPIGRWFRVEAYMHQATDNSGDVKFWIDGVFLLEAPKVPTVPTDWLYWAVGGAAPNIAEQPAEVFLDDAAILRDGPGK